MSEKHLVMHHGDQDGAMSAALVSRNLELSKVALSDIRFVPMQYGGSVPDIGEDETVWILDFSLQPLDKMQGVINELGSRLVWIDHHDTSLQYVEQDGFDAGESLVVVRTKGQDGRPIAACELVWETLFKPVNNPPLVVKLIGEWDTWRHMDEPDSELSKDTVALKYWTDGFAVADTEEGLGWYIRALENKSLVNKAVAEGRILEDYSARLYEQDMRQHSFEGEFAGYPAVMYNGTGKGSLRFESVYNPSVHDLMVSYCFDGKAVNVGLYSTKPYIHCGEIAKKMGNGGGHPGAAGFQTTMGELPKMIEVGTT